MAIKTETLEQRVLRFINDHHLMPRGEKVVMAVSGGPDSVCLLHVLAGLQKELGVSLHVAHLDHQLRGAESAADARYVAGLARRLDIPATIDSRDVKGYRAHHRLSLEEAAREVRYDFLAEVAESVGAGRVAVGHTLDDHIETILMHLIRGSGIKGLGGLQPSVDRNSGRLTIVRPLLEVSRQETADYCREHRLKPHLDATNRSLSPLRNRIRLQLLPRLKGYNPGIAEALLRTARIAAEDIAFLDEEVGRRWGKLDRRENAIVLDKARLNNLPPSLQRHLLRMSIEELLGNLKDIEARHIEGIMDALAKPAGKRIALPGGLQFFVEYDRYLIGTESASLSPFPLLEGETALAVPGETRLSGWKIEAAIVDAKELSQSLEGTLDLCNGKAVKGLRPFTISSSPSPSTKERGIQGVRFPNPLTACFDFDKVGGKLAMRPRHPGDRFQPLGMARPKKLGQFMIDARVPQAWRERVPIVTSEGQVIWVAGWRIDERFKITAKTKRVLRLRLTRI